MKPDFTRSYLIQFIDGDHAYSEGRDGKDAARLAEERWGVEVFRYQIPRSPYWIRHMSAMATAV